MQAQKRVKTLLGFYTENAAWGRGMDVAYVLVMIVAFAFAHSSFSYVMIGWNEGWRQALLVLVAAGIIGLCYTVKIVLFGGKRFTIVGASAAFLVAVLPWQLDFVGFYAETGYHDSLEREKIAATKVVSDYDVKATDKIAELASKIEADKAEALAAADRYLDEQVGMLQSRISSAKLLVVDEKVGVKTGQTTGIVGAGDQAKIRESELRRAEQELADKKPRIEAEVARRKAAADADAASRLASLVSAKAELDTLVPRAKFDEDGNPFEVKGEDVPEPVLEQIASASTFDELGEAARKANTAMSTVSSLTGTPVAGVIVSSDNVFEMSYAALQRGDITAIVCFFMAFLMEIVDILIAYAKRREDAAYGEDTDDDSGAGGNGGAGGGPRLMSDNAAPEAPKAAAAAPPVATA
jgi:hypothetical protein